MLVTKEVEVEYTNKILKYYEDLGYKFPRYIDKNGNVRIKRGTKITVKIEDLNRFSRSLVTVRCDYELCDNQDFDNIEKILNNYLKLKEVI